MSSVQRTNIRDSSLAAYDEYGGLLDCERPVLAFFHRVGNEGKSFTRAEVAEQSGIAINLVTGRVNALIKKKKLIECASEDRRLCAASKSRVKVYTVSLPQRSPQQASLFAVADDVITSRAQPGMSRQFQPERNQA